MPLLRLRRLASAVSRRSLSLRIAAVDIGTHDLRWWAPEILDRYPGGFYQIHKILMEEAAEKINASVEVIQFEARNGEFPPEDFDGVLISGCANCATDNEEWLENLRQWIRETKLKLSGFSFAPQVIAAAMGGTVAKNPKGTELSVVQVQLSDAFKTRFRLDQDSYSIHVHHNDAVLSLPPGGQSLGGSRVTEHLGWFLNNSVLAFSGHPEYSYDPWILERLMLIEERDHLVPAQLIQYGLRDLYLPTDYKWQNEIQLKWFRGDFDDL